MVSVVRLWARISLKILKSDGKRQDIIIIIIIIIIIKYLYSAYTFQF